MPRKKAKKPKQYCRTCGREIHKIRLHGEERSISKRAFRWVTVVGRNFYCVNGHDNWHEPKEA